MMGQVAALHERNSLYKPFCDPLSFQKTFELRKDAKRPQSNSNFMNKIGGRSNTEFSNLDS